MLGKFIDRDFIQKPVKCESMTENYPEFLVASLNYAGGHAGHQI
jgi:hypothetical protein